MRLLLPKAVILENYVSLTERKKPSAKEQAENYGHSLAFKHVFRVCLQILHLERILFLLLRLDW